MLTVHERLAVLCVVIHPPRCCASACKAGVRSECGDSPREARLQAPFRPPLQPEPEPAQLNPSRLDYPTLTKAIWRPLKSHR